MSQWGDLWTRWIQKRPEKEPESTSGGKGLAVLVLVGVALMMLGRGGGEPVQPAMGKAQVTEAGPAPAQEERMARELRQVLSSIAGAGEVQVYVTLEAGAEVVVAEETTVQKTLGSDERGGDLQQETRRPVTLRDDAARAEKPLILLERKPTVRGVIVVAAGANSPRIRYQLTRAVQTALAVSASRVEVFAMDSPNALRR